MLFRFALFLVLHYVLLHIDAVGCVLSSFVATNTTEVSNMRLWVILTNRMKYHGREHLKSKSQFDNEMK